MEPVARHDGRRAFWLTAGALAWGAGLVVAALLVPVYGSSSASAPTGVAHVSSSSLTLVQVNGVQVLIPIAVPAIVAVLVGLALHRKCTRGDRLSGLVAWALIATLLAGCVIALASVGLSAAPVAGLLAYAASITPSGGVAARTCVG